MNHSAIIERNTWSDQAERAPLSVRVLLVEDDSLDAELVLERLKDDGIDVNAKIVLDENGYKQGLSEFNPDIVLSDLTLPGFSGERALRLLRAQDKRTPFIFVSGTIGEAAAIEALRGGATDYILKGNMARLPSAVRSAVANAAERRARDLAEAELVKAQRFETLAILAGSLGHDLRNILQPVLMATQLIESKGSDPEIQRLCAMIRNCSDQGLELVSAMMALARGGQSGSDNRIKLAALLDAIGLLFKPSLPKNVDLVIDDVDPALEIPGKANELQQCLLNLALNAVQAMPDGGCLKIMVERFKPDPDFFREEEPRHGTDYVRISVSDTGHGMDQGTLDKLFTPFFTTKASGNGLGLVSCRRFVENHHGVLRVTSEVGVGSRFDLCLPIEIEKSERKLQPGEGISGFDGNEECILIVSDNSAACGSVVDILDLYGYVPVPAASVEEATAIFNNTSSLRVAIIDCDLLVKNDHAVMALRSVGFSGPFILFGAGRSSGIAIDGVAAHLSMPVTAPALLGALHEALPQSGSDG